MPAVVTGDTGACSVASNYRTIGSFAEGRR